MCREQGAEAELLGRLRELDRVTVLSERSLTVTTSISSSVMVNE